MFKDDIDQVNCPICLENIFEVQNSCKTAKSIVSGDPKFEKSQSAASDSRQGEKVWDLELEDFNITILCCHTFNQKCLDGWSGNEPNPLGDSDTLEDQADTCPLCRYY